MFRMGAAPMASETTEGTTAPSMDDETRKATLVNLISSKRVPTFSALQWMVVQEACTQLLDRERELIAALATSKKTIQSVEVGRPRVSANPLVPGKTARQKAQPVRPNLRRQFAPTAVDIVVDGSTSDPYSSYSNPA
jgi:hypothetical protein